jgi:hypothetical protein
MTPEGDMSVCVLLLRFLIEELGRGSGWWKLGSFVDSGCGAAARRQARQHQQSLFDTSVPRRLPFAKQAICEAHNSFVPFLFPASPPTWNISPCKSHWSQLLARNKMYQSNALKRRPTEPAITMSGLFGANTAAANASNPTQGDLSKDIPVANPPEDSISAIRFSPASEHIAAASWDKKVRIWEVDGNGNTQGRAMMDFEGPVLDCCWSKVKHSSYHFLRRSEQANAII